VDYEFTYDDYGKLVIHLEMGQEALSHWLNSTIANDATRLASVLTLLEDLRTGKEREAHFTENGFDITMSRDEVDVLIVSNDVLDEQHQEEGLTLYEDEQASGCGLEDLLHLLRDWQDFRYH